MHTKEYSVEIGGKTITAVFSDLAEQANGSVILKCEDTIVMATACISADGKDNRGFFNLTVEYMEKFYAAGLILGGQYNKREGRPSDEAILTARIIDRTIRPLFAHHIKNVVQVIVTVLSVGQADPGVLGVNAASLALATSDIPWAGPVGAVHVGKGKGTVAIEDGIEFAIDRYIPNTGESNYELDLTVCGKDGNVVMIEAMAYEYDETKMGAALDLAMPAIATLEKWQKDIVAEIGKKKMDMPAPAMPEEVKNLFAETVGKKLDIIFGEDGKKAFHTLDSEWNVAIGGKAPYRGRSNPEHASIAQRSFWKPKARQPRACGKAIKENKRPDGRAFDQVRTIYAKAGGFSPVLHGSGIFYRGETHVLSVLTLGGPEDATLIEGMEIRGTKRFTHHYYFPPYSAGETGRVGGINRREMGHGFLAEKALVPVIPDKMTFPYTIRLVSESMASNGSTSQASICGSSIALMDGGVPIKRPVAGIADGPYDGRGESEHVQDTLRHSGTGRSLRRHGSQGRRNSRGDHGHSAGHKSRRCSGAGSEGSHGRGQGCACLGILDTIEKEIAAPRADIAPTAPKILVMKIRPDQIGGVIGSGGKIINGIREKTGAELTIEDDGTVYVTGKNGAADAALVIVQEMTHEYKVGEEMEGEVVKIIEVGAIVKISSSTDGLVHISELAPWRVNKVGPTS